MTGGLARKVAREQWKIAYKRCPAAWLSDSVGVYVCVLGVRNTTRRICLCECREEMEVRHIYWFALFDKRRKIPWLYNMKSIRLRLCVGCLELELELTSGASYSTQFSTQTLYTYQNDFIRTPSTGTPESMCGGLFLPTFVLLGPWKSESHSRNLNTHRHTFTVIQNRTRDSFFVFGILLVRTYNVISYLCDMFLLVTMFR